MCTLIVLNNVHPDYPLIIAANRDEFHSRKSIAPGCINEEPMIWAGLDKEAGGTWFGLSKAGFFVGITNQRTKQSRKKHVLSRGQIVLNALKSNSVDRVCEQLLKLDPGELNPFNLLFGDIHQLKVAYCHSHMSQVEICSVPHGSHVLPNGRLNDPNFPKVRRSLEKLNIQASHSWDQIKAQCIQLLSNHEKASLQSLKGQQSHWTRPGILLRELDALCVHAGPYGTCSSSLIALKDGGVRHYHYAAGAPCRAPFQDLNSLIAT